jgi:hypothetical protein
MSATTFTVFFEDPFWVGVLEVADEQGVRAARHVFGAEPGAQELYAFGFSRDYDRLVRRAEAAPPALPARGPGPARPVSPKRAARLAAREQAAIRPSTAAQAAVKAALEQSKTQRRAQSRAQREDEEARRRDLARAKAKARHRGR